MPAGRPVFLLRIFTRTKHLRQLAFRQLILRLFIRRTSAGKSFPLRQHALLLISLLLLLAAAGCQSQPEESPPDPALATIALVNGQPIRQVDLDLAAEDYYSQVDTDDFIVEAPETDASAAGDSENTVIPRDTDKITDEMKIPVLEDMIHRLLIYEYAQEEGYQVSEQDVEAAFLQMKHRYNDNDFEPVLERYYLTEQGLKDQIHLRLVNQLFLDELDIDFEPSYITDEDREEAYRIYRDEVDDPKPMEEVVWLLDDYILFRQEEQAYQMYMDDFLASLRDEADIEIFFPGIYESDEREPDDTN